MSTLTFVRSQSIHTPVLTPMLTVLAFINILKNGIRYGNILIIGAFRTNGTGFQAS